MRTERDFLGECYIPHDALYGIHSFRARENFPDNTAFQLDWYRAAGNVKLACYETYKNYKSALISKFDISKLSFQIISDEIIDALIAAATEISQGKHFEWFIVPAIQGGAGTSINMNINEIIANIALIKCNRKPGDYHYIDPIEHANIFSLPMM